MVEKVPADFLSPAKQNIGRDFFNRPSEGGNFGQGIVCFIFSEVERVWRGGVDGGVGRGKGFVRDGGGNEDGGGRRRGFTAGKRGDGG